jgi:regulator of PEP synthase PpsR (kinase-PPPase family)
MESKKKILWVVSDGTGRTALEVLKAASYQFENPDFEYRTVGEVTSVDRVVDLIDRVKAESGMVVYTLVSGSLRRALHHLCVENHILCVDLFGPVITTLQKFLQKVPLESPGLSYKLNRDYFRMVDAIDFTITHDDGRMLDTADKADIILVGPSRVGKTPLSIYLGYLGWKVANLPVVKGRELPPFIDRCSGRVFCLVIQPTLLQRRRVDRVKKLGDPNIEGYVDLSSINEELEYSRRIADGGNRWPVLDMSFRPVEEIARQIIQLISIENSEG